MQGRDALERLRAKQQQRRQRQYGTIATNFLASFFPLDVTYPRSVEAFREDCVNGHLGGRVDILFNNAGVCFPEQDGNGPQNNRAAAARILRETLAVNFFGALEVVEACMPALQAAAPMVARKEKKKAALMLEDNGATSTMKSLKPPTVVWISSGDGELCFLGSKWRGLLAEAQSLEVTGVQCEALNTAVFGWGGSRNSARKSSSNGESKQSTRFEASVSVVRNWCKPSRLSYRKYAFRLGAVQPNVHLLCAVQSSLAPTLQRLTPNFPPWLSRNNRT